MSTHFTRRHFVTLAGTAATGLFLASTLSGCAKEPVNIGAGTGAGSEIDYNDWEAVLKAAKGQTVSWYGWGGSEPRNTWVNSVLAPVLLEKYEVTLDLVGMDINDILTQLSGEMQAGIEAGNIDFIWINGENFYSAKANGYLWGPFCSYLPNFNDYVDAESPEIAYDFGAAVEGYEAPYGKTQMQMWVDSAKISATPENPEDFLAFCQEYAGKISYPEPGDFIGTAFISSLIAGVIGRDTFEQLSMIQQPTIEAVKAIVDPGLEYLRSLNPYLWKQGATFPADSATVSTMYADGELVMNMGYGAPEALVNDGLLPETTHSFIFDTGTVGNTNFMAIANNAPRKAAALVAINEMLSPEMQLSQYAELANISVLDMNRLSDEQRADFDSLPTGITQIPISDLLEHRIVEAAGPVIPLLEQLWHDEVVGK